MYFPLRLTRNLLATMCVLLVASFCRVAAQTETGRESVKAEVNLTELANYYAAHPEPAERMELENEDDNEPRPHHPPVTDSTLIHRRRAGTMRTTGVHIPEMPPSPLPTDTFESVFDPGTAIPPDTHGAVDSNYCITAINTTVEIQTRTGALAIPTVTLNQFFSPVSPANSTFDPRVHYDPYTNRWMLICVDGANNSADSTSILIAISKTSNPTGAWWMYKVRAYIPHDYWLDFPDVGFDKKWIVVTGNLFQNEPGSGYNGAKVFAFNKANLLSGAGAPYTSFTQSSSFTICPSLTYDTSEVNMYAVETWDGTATGGGQMQLWKISGAVGSEAMTSMGFIASTGFNWQSTSYAITGGSTADSDFAPQTGSTYLVRCNDDRLDQMVQMNGKLWFAHTVFLPYSTTVNPSRCSIQWFETDTLGNPDQVGLIDDAVSGHFFAFPSMAVNTGNDALIGFSDFAATLHPSAAYALRMASDPADSMRTLYLYRHGQNTYYKTYGGQTSRWGDYSGTALDPLNQTDFWTIQEVSSPTANDWDTWWAYVKLCSPPAAITGASPVCVGDSETLVNDTAGGTWTSNNTTVAAVGSVSGTVTGVTAGSAVITYTINGGCIATATVAVNAVPFTYSGASALCVGSSTTLTDPTGSGSWYSGSTTIATIGSSSGSVTGVSAGTALISYVLPTGCYSAAPIIIDNTPPGITGTMTMCAGSGASLSDGAPGGTWSTSNALVATVGTMGNVSGVAAGTAAITYTISGGCLASTIVTVYATPAAITGTETVCASLTTPLNDGTGGGSWVSGNTAVATVGSGSGTVGGVSAGTALISYVLGDGCLATAEVTVDAAPAAISGPSGVCVSSSISLTDGVGGGTWSSSNALVATVGTAGNVSGVAAGSATISYTLPGNCMVTDDITVNPSPGAILDASALCVGYSETLSDADPGGTWTSSNTAVATVGSSSASLAGVGVGTAAITYDLGAGCIATTIVTINPVPAAITGTTTFCSLASSLLSNTVFGGVWSSSNSLVATVSGGGLVSGVSSGSAVISYTLGVGCFATATVTLLESPSAITGTTSVCIAGTSPLGDGIGGGTWVSSNTGIATVGSLSGSATGMAIGSAIITYTLSDGCNTTTMFAVTPATAAPITGPAIVCLGQAITLSDATGGGAWTSSNPLKATVSSGVVTGVATGSTTISYTVLTACGTAIATKVIGIDPVPSVSGISASLTTVCTGATISLTDATASGIWSSGNTSIATVGSLTGTVTGMTAGTTAVSYTVTNTEGCSSSATVAVTVTNPLAATVTPLGPTYFCTGGSVVLQATTGVGLTYQWMLGGTAISGATNATFLTGTGGDYTVSVNSGHGCVSVAGGLTVTVNPSPIVLPTDNITAVPGTILCLVTSPVTFTATSANGGSSPVYRWYVNGAYETSGTTYTYSPVNGDLVKCVLTSNDICAFPDTAVATTAMTISPLETPAVGINAVPGIAVCTGEAITLTAVPVYGGAAPTYLWTKNTVNVATGPAYIYVPANGDIVQCTMTSDYPCLATNVASDVVTLSVLPPDVNTVNITVSQSIIGAGTTDTFRATAPFGGSSPAYQWLINGLPVTGATSAVFVTSSLVNGDVVSCEESSSDPCAEPHTVTSGGISVIVAAAGVGALTAANSLTLEPNPNNGSFTISGQLAMGTDNRITITVIDVLGQTVYQASGLAANGAVSQQVQLPASVASGAYLVSVANGDRHFLFRMDVYSK